MGFILPAPLFYVVLESADTLESARCLIRLTQREDTLKFREISHLRNVVSLTEPAVKQVIEISRPPSLFRIWLFCSPLPRIYIKVVDVFSSPVRIDFAWPEDRRAVEKRKQWLFNGFICSYFVHTLEESINGGIAPVFPELRLAVWFAIDEAKTSQKTMEQPAFGLIPSYPASTHICELLPEITDAAINILLAEHIIEDDQPIPIIKLPDCFRIEVSGIERLGESLLIYWQFMGDGVLCVFLHDDNDQMVGLYLNSAIIRCWTIC